jgi:lipid II:glycine glycyltransferase (peptidoglycan interpeptide bridge formation enzyme)
MDFRQSEPFAAYLNSQGWEKLNLKDGTNIFAYPVPFLGNIIRVPRPRTSIDIEELLKVSRKLNAILIKIEPDVLSSDKNLQENLKKNGFVKDKWSIEPTRTLFIDLKKSKDQIFSGIKPKWRQYIRLSEKSEVFINESDDINSFIRLWSKNASRKGYFIESSNQTGVLYKNLKNVKKVKTLFAFVDNQPVAAAFLIFWGETCYLWHLAYTGQSKNLRPLYLLVWESIMLAKQNRLKFFDFDGIGDERYPYSLKVQPTFFKKGFGGQEKEYTGSYVFYIKKYHSLPYIMVGLLNPIIFRFFIKSRPAVF